MTNRFYNEGFDAPTGSLAKSATLDVQFSAVETGFELVQAELDALAGISGITSLSGFPASFSDSGLKYLRVNAAESAVEFVSGGSVVIRTTAATSYTAVAADAGALVLTTNASAVTFTVPPDVFAQGDIIMVQQQGAGQVTFAEGSGVTINSSDDLLSTRKQFAQVALICTDTNVFSLIGERDVSTITASNVGRHAIYIAAGSMSPSATGGCASLATVATSSNQPDIQSLDFDATTQEFAQFSVTMPKSWDEGTVTFSAIWSHASTTTNFGVVWQLQGVAISDDDAIATAYGTAQTSTDTGGTTNDKYKSPESSAITIAGTPAAEDTVFFRVARNPSDGSDTLAIDARLMGIVLYITTNAATDA